MKRLILAAGFAAVVVGCGSSESGKKDAATSVDMGAITPDTGTSADSAAKDATSATLADAGADAGDSSAPGDSSASDAPASDTAAPDAATPDAALDVTADLAAPDSSAPDLAPDVKPDAGVDAVAMCGNIKCDCTFTKDGKTWKLYGKYRVDDIFPDFTVREVTFNEDLKVRKVDFFPDACGKWQRDDVFYDFKVRFVTFNEDFKIRYVDFNEGLP